LLNHQILIQEIPGVGRVSEDPTNFRGSEYDKRGAFVRKETFDVALTAEVKFSSGPNHQIVVPQLRQVFDDR